MRGEAGESPIQAIILADQSFPAVLPVETGGQCFKIFRTENGSISGMVEKLLKDMGNRRTPPGSVVLIGSISHLADVGLSAYIEDLIEAERRIKTSLSRDVKVGPLPPTTLTGVAVPSVVRELFELMTWAVDYYPADVALEDTMKLAATIIRENGEGIQSYLEPRRLRLLSRDEAKYKLWHSGGSTPPLLIPVSVLALQQPDEKRLVKAMIEEIRSKLVVDLDPNPTFERGLGGQERPKQARDFLVIGSSNASKLSKALSQQGYSSCCIFNQNFWIDTASMEDIRPQVKEAIRDMDPSVIVFHCLDNSIYYSRTPDGSRTAPKKGQDGNFHVEGEVTVCSRDVLNEHLTALRPLLELVGKKRGIVISPQPRYVVTGCCSNPEHCSNRRLLDYEQQQQQSLDIIKRSIKDCLFCHGLRFI
jgi:hypothetical protein